jgi:putative component of membrane protein insertase Oxa1/YidC/SpoIIIJ protein YidD
MTLCVILMVFCFPGPGFTKRACADPFEMITGQGASEREDHQGHSENNVGAWLASFFSEHVSAVDGDRCPSEPTCSSFSVQAFKKHGLVMGWLMTVDRLIHEGDEWTVSPVNNRNGKGKIIDPIENNDFWWYPDGVQSANR